MAGEDCYWEARDAECTRNATYRPKTSDLYRTVCDLPARFEHPSWFYGYGVQRPAAQPRYRTTSSDYGRYPPSVHTVPTCYYPTKQTFSSELAAAGMYRYAWSRANHQWLKDGQLDGPVPVFEQALSARELSVFVGQTAILPCIVRNLGDKVVSWIRTRDLHILTSGVHVFTSDSRFEVVHKVGTDFWGLKIKKTQLADAGKYECQVNTDPKMNNAMILAITDSHMHDSPVAGTGRMATIQGPHEQYVRAGATITFMCVVSRAPFGGVTHQLPAATRPQLTWTQAGRDVTFQSSRGGISVDTDYREPQITSRLTVAMVTHEDSGNYTCQDVDVAPATVTLVVIEGERSEAMQRDYPNRAAGVKSPLQVGFILYLLWVLR